MLYRPASIEICAGAGGQALGLEQAGFEHECLVEIDRHACLTLAHNRPHWKTLELDVKEFKASKYKGIDLLAGGLPCPPFSKAGKQLGKDDERNLFPEALRLADECRPRAIMIENVRGLLDPVFADYRAYFQSEIEKMGYKADWKLLNASNFGVSQLRPRVLFVALKNQHTDKFEWPVPSNARPLTVGELLFDLMASNGWEKAAEWRDLANDIAPTLVGGSKKHGGPDLGPTRAKRAWEKLAVNGLKIGNEPPLPGYSGLPHLTIPMVARIQGFPDDWTFAGAKTHAYRQVGNAFPPPVARAVAERIFDSLSIPGIVSVAV